MDLSQNHLSFAQNLHSDSGSPVFSSNHPTSLDDLFASHGTDGEMDMGLEWLSTFVEDCLSSTGNCLPPTIPQMHPPKNVQTTSPPPPPAASAEQKQSDHNNVKKTTSFFLQRIAIPGKARSKRKRRCRPASSSSSSVLNLKAARTQLSCWFRQDHQSFSDPPLLVQQAYWLADSELIVNPNINNTSSKNQEQEQQLSSSDAEAEVVVDTSGGQGQQQRRCSHCLAQRTPQWRAGPLGPKTLCNACGVRYKSGRLLPEYRPAKSPTFVSYKHSNSHKKVMEMRMALLQSNS